MLSCPIKLLLNLGLQNHPGYNEDNIVYDEQKHTIFHSKVNKSVLCLTKFVYIK